MAQLAKDGGIYHYGEKIGEYEKCSGYYNANLGAWLFDGVSFQFHKTKAGLLRAIRKRLSTTQNWYKFTQFS